MSSQVGKNDFLTLQSCRHPGEKSSSSSIICDSLSIKLLLKWFEQVYHNPDKSLHKQWHGKLAS